MKHIGLSRHADYHSEYVGDLEDAIACFDRALALQPDHADAREALRVKPGYLAASLRLARVQQEIGRGQSDAKGPG